MSCCHAFGAHQASALGSSAFLATRYSQRCVNPLKCCAVDGKRTEHAPAEVPSTFGNDASSSGSTPSMVTVSYRGQSISVQRGTLLRTALLQCGSTPHNGQSQVINCRGLGTCGTCSVQISGDVLPVARGARESARLNFPPHSPPQAHKLRLACQVVCMGDLEVVKYDGFWGQGTTPLGAMPPGEVMSSPWLGALEYVLEPVSAGKLASAGQQSSAGQPKQ